MLASLPWADCIQGCLKVEVETRWGTRGNKGLTESLELELTWSHFCQSLHFPPQLQNMGREKTEKRKIAIAAGKCGTCLCRCTKINLRSHAQLFRHMSKKPSADKILQGTTSEIATTFHTLGIFFCHSSYFQILSFCYHICLQSRGEVFMSVCVFCSFKLLTPMSLRKSQMQKFAAIVSNSISR